MTTDGRSAYALAGPEELREIIERYREGLNESLQEKFDELESRVVSNFEEHELVHVQLNREIERLQLREAEHGKRETEQAAEIARLRKDIDDLTKILAFHVLGKGYADRQGMR
jgi:regulator of replication initiation timing